MRERFRCETNIIQEDCEYTIRYFLTTEDDCGFGIKATMYANQKLKSTNLFDLTLSRDKAEELIDMFCVNHVFPQSYNDILSDMFR